ncbi:hypothetical protein AXG93_1104s1190 [Marchantia polymorpha subsp. ruderalis]|uniref:Uncharacterized protein n=1 Tax=Marchantia polymorpha subsp. ruderalis TaxID=1480154 RepID=A0A176WMW8_MARPO|nr:hypothetical protein AXG93_1104s1190 [Marchantia polymorpha subsp. ruderalis]
MVREWMRKRNQPPRGFRPHPKIWQVSDWQQVLGRCAGEESHLLFECESVQVTKEEEIFFGALFKNNKSSKKSNPGRYVKDVQVDTDTDETPACTPLARPQAEEEPRAV